VGSGALGREQVPELRHRGVVSIHRHLFVLGGRQLLVEEPNIIPIRRALRIREDFKQLQNRLHSVSCLKKHGSKPLKTLVGATGFEPVTPCAQGGSQALLKSIEMWSPQLVSVEPLAAWLLRAMES
jgi:hypothetical protein